MAQEHSAPTHAEYAAYPDKLWRKLVSWLSYPLVLGGIIGGMIWVLEFRPEATGAAFVTCMLLGPLCVFVLEKLQPHCRAWHPSWRTNVRTDVSTLLINGALTAAISEPLKLTLFALLGALLASALPWSLWPDSQPLFVQLCLALLVGDLGSYWYHRKVHEWPIGWRFHAVHHSSDRLYWLNGARFHFLDITLYNLAATLPLALLGAGTEIFLLVALFTACHGYFQHGNVRVQLGPLNYIFSMAELHRWHHSKEVEVANHNYGNNTIIWDWVFGSYYWPKGELQASDDVGPGHYAMPLTFWRLFLWPFTRNSGESSQGARGLTGQ